MLDARPSRGEERQIVTRLGEIGSNASIAALRQRAHRSSDPGVREQAAIALNKRDTEAAQTAMITLLDTPDPRIASFAAWVLATRSRNSADFARRTRPALYAAVPSLAGALGDAKPATRRMAIRALLLIATPEARAALEASSALLPWRQRRRVRRGLRHL
jgi:HEAT repeat protein